jgi:shikimate dehydrogenase
MHNRALANAGLNAVYLPMLVENVGPFFWEFVHLPSRRMRWRLRGFSVTVPHKSAVIPYLDEVDPTALRVGAVNTVVIENERSLGYNTDLEGAIAPLKALTDLKGVECAVVGAGGSARAVVFGLAKEGAVVRIYTRDKQKGAALASEFKADASSIEDLVRFGPGIIINTTPVGMLGHSEGQSVIPAQALKNCKIAYDLIYNPLETRFLKDAREAGCKTLGGIEMLVAQAARQFELWTGITAPIDLMRSAVLEKVTTPR